MNTILYDRLIKIIYNLKDGSGDYDIIYRDYRTKYFYPTSPSSFIKKSTLKRTLRQMVLDGILNKTYDPKTREAIFNIK